jgi:hypothetical protein
VSDKYFEDRLKREDEVWTTSRFVGLLFVTLAIALTVIFTIASLRSGDFTWSPLAHDPVRELPPSDWGHPPIEDRTPN